MNTDSIGTLHGRSVKFIALLSFDPNVNELC